MISINYLFENKQFEAEYNLLHDIMNKYKNKIPIYTDKIIFKKNVIPVSHPILTLNLRWKDSKNPNITLLSLLIHEQLHWFEDKYVTKTKYNEILKDYEYLFDEYKTIFYNDIVAFIIHIVVIVNEINIMKMITTKKEFEQNYYDINYHRPYELFEKHVIDNFKELNNYLKQKDLIWDKDKELKK